MTDEEFNEIKARAADMGDAPFKLMETPDEEFIFANSRRDFLDFRNVAAALNDLAVLIAEVERLREGDREARDLFKFCAPECELLDSPSGVISQSLKTYEATLTFSPRAGDTTRGDA